MAEKTTSVSPSLAQPVRPRIAFLLWATVLTFAAALMFGIYWFIATFHTSCTFGEYTMGPIRYVSGGPPESVTTAAVIDAVLWLAAGLAGWHFSRRRGRVFLAFAVLYVVALVVLWEITPAIWGKGICP